MRATAIALAGLGILALAIVGDAEGQMMGGQGGGMMGGQDMARMNPATRARDRDFWRGGVAAAYRSARNPLSADAKTLATGRTVYRDNCAACHGASGRGDGEAGQDLDPKPVDLTAMRYRNPRMAAPMFYAISEGGEAYGSAMPAFKDGLSESERWAVISYIQSGFAP